ncbi:MAG TPA: hypothetical protein VFY29_17825, partial [Terriglobia bacterium]|nr:hypothetical protein [Terriglobia bacterium]
MKRYALLTAVVLATVIPFASRAVFMDEHIFLNIARSAQTHWFFPQDTPGMFFGSVVPDFASHTHPPVGEYYLALIYAVMGRFEDTPFRLAFSVFPIAAVLAFYSLARRFVAEPLWVALLFALSPAFVVYAPTLMMDVPMLAFLLVGFALYFKSVDGVRRALFPASVCFVLAVGTGYTALIPLACFFVGLLTAGRPPRELLSVMAAPAALALWLAAMTVHFGRFPLWGTVTYFLSQGSMLWNFVAVFTFVGGVTLFPLAASGKPLLSAGAFAVALVAMIGFPAGAAPLWIVVLIASGAFMIARFFSSARELIASGRNSGEAFLLLWFPAVMIFFVVAADMINGRYVLLGIPALYLVAFRKMNRRSLIGMVIPTALLSLGVAYGDYRLVNANRDFVKAVVEPLLTQGVTVWGGAESG